jgi:hypothetical protein
VADVAGKGMNGEGEFFGDNRLEACVWGEEPLERILNSVGNFAAIISWMMIVLSLISPSEVVTALRSGGPKI